MSIEWPDGFDRTLHAHREPHRGFRVSLAEAVAHLETELDRLDPDNWRVSFGNTHSKSNGMPLHNANPDDPGFVLRWTKGGDDYVVACDSYTALRDNVREVGLWLKETRKRGNRAVETGSEEYAAARLPPGGQAGEDPIALDAGGGGTDWSVLEPHQVLRIDADADPQTIVTAFQERVKEAHPDNGGSMAELDAVREARGKMLAAGRGVSPRS